MSEEVKAVGTITHILDIVTGGEGDRAWAKVQFVINTGGEHPRDIPFTIFGTEKVDKFLKYNKVGHEVEVSYDLRGNEFNGKWYTDANAWKVWGLDRNNANAVPAEAEEDDDLPF